MGAELDAKEQIVVEKTKTINNLERKVDELDSSMENEKLDHNNKIEELTVEIDHLRILVEKYANEQSNDRNLKPKIDTLQNEFKQDIEELVVDVDLPNGTVAELIVKQGEDVSIPVKAFAKKHGIPQRVAKCLENYVVSQLGSNEKGLNKGKSPRFDASPRRSKSNKKMIESPPPPPPFFEKTQEINSKNIETKPVENRRLSRLRRLSTQT